MAEVCRRVGIDCESIEFSGDITPQEVSRLTEAARDALHGHQVACALLVQLVLEERPGAFVDDVADFHRQTRLPTCLTDLGLPDSTGEDIQRIAEGTMTAGSIKNFSRPLAAHDIAGAVRAVEARHRHS